MSAEYPRDPAPDPLKFISNFDKTQPNGNWSHRRSFERGAESAAASPGVCIMNETLFACCISVMLIHAAMKQNSEWIPQVTHA